MLISLASFPMSAAFPRAEYSDASDAHTGHWQTACLGIPVCASPGHKAELCEVREVAIPTTTHPALCGIPKVIRVVQGAS